MRIKFTKMQGAGNDFVVLDETQGLLGLTAAQYRFLADRHFGVGADQILSVRAAPSPDVDFQYVIHNADGGEVEHCGNGARCFVRFVQAQGLSNKTVLTVQTMNRVLSLALQADGRVSVNMGAPMFDLAQVPFDAEGLLPKAIHSWQQWPLAAVLNTSNAIINIANIANVAVLSMGNPHAVQLVDDVDTAAVAQIGPLVEGHARFARRVNAGFMQVVNRSEIRLRVYERGAGETLACGTGACAAVVTGIRLGMLDARVDVRMRGGSLMVEWSGEPNAPVLLTGPATIVFSSEIDVPDAAECLL
ncbi:MAG: diaminopimelate epimerase [Chitinophagaceae bacterium]|nr:diaminopimelate epimerase [Polaromonas sp.]